MLHCVIDGKLGGATPHPAARRDPNRVTKPKLHTSPQPVTERST